jgi:hypothetical protein
MNSVAENFDLCSGNIARAIRIAKGGTWRKLVDACRIEGFSSLEELDAFVDATKTMHRNLQATAPIDTEVRISESDGYHGDILAVTFHKIVAPTEEDIKWMNRFFDKHRGFDPRGQ